MPQLVNKENITVVIEKYTDNQGNEKSKYRTIGELVTMRGDDGSTYQFGSIWGPHGSTKFNVYSQDDNNQQNTQQNNHQQGQQQRLQQQQGGLEHNNQQQYNNGGYQQR